MLSSQMRILRVFGVPESEVSAELRAARDEGCPGLRLLQHDGEFAICIQVSAPTREMANQYCDRWERRLRERFGDAVYGTGEISLAQATLDALLQKRRLIVAADEPTGRLMGALLHPLEHSEAVFDFGTQTYQKPENARRIVTPPSLMQKFPGDFVQAAAGRAQLALALGGADYGAVYMPATVGQAPFVLLCDKRVATAVAVRPEMNDAAIANQILDLARRRALGLKPSAATISFRPGHEHPLLIVSSEGQPRGNTVRFSLHRPAARKTAPAAPAEPVAAPAGSGRNAAMAEAIRAASEADWAAPPAREPSVDAAPTGTITFEAPAAARPAPQPAPSQPDDPMNFTTAGPAAAAASRAARQGAAASAPLHRSAPAAPPAEPQPQPSLLDEEIPDFTAGLDPDAVAAAMAADEAAPPSSEEDLQRAATLLFSLDGQDAPKADRKAERKIDRKAARPQKAAAASASPATGRPAPIRNHSLAMIERAERRRHRNVVATMVILLLLVLAGGTALFLYLRSDLGTRPAAKSYGTGVFDETVENYLGKALNKRPGVTGYLAFPGLDGTFVYTAAAAADNDTDAARPAIAGENWLDSATPANTVLDLDGDALAGYADLETAKENAGFTLYLPGETYRYKVVAVYYENGDDGTAFDPAAYTDLSDYYDYLDFALAIGSRSLYETAAATTDNGSFLTLVSDSENGKICVTGRRVKENENAQLVASAVKASASTRLADQLTRYTTLTSDATEADAAAADSKTTAAGEDGTASFNVDDLSEQTQALIASADKLLEGLTDIAGSGNAVETNISQGAEGSLPEQTLSVESLLAATAAPTEAPTEPPADSASEGSSDAPADPTPAPEATPAPAGGSSAEGETINVTMNGSAQSMDLVTCLAMIAQNELGPNAPAEAYKAQCVAAHCWILSQGGYPSVSGTTPGSAALAAAQEVAHVLVTYNGAVCFTPYFASASTGTASSADVWGGARAYLQAVDSPYDQSVASNWNTNGYSSGSARFSRETLQNRIQEKMSVDLSGVDPNSWFTILSTNAYGWVSQIQIGPNASGNDTCSGRWFRETLLAGQSVDGRSLRSQCFTVSYDADLDCFIFDVYGYGHGCGMSQWGAIGYAQNGWSYQDILTHYFVGTTITSY